MRSKIDRIGEKNIKEVANYYKNKIPNKLYQSLYNYIVEIDD